MLGLPGDAWMLLFFAVGLGLTLELTFVLARRREREGASRDEASTDGGGPA